MFKRKKYFLKKRENRNENLTASAKESEYTAADVRDSIG